LASVSSVEPASKVNDPCTDSVPMELPAASVPLLVTAPTIVPLPPSLPSGSMVTVGLVSVPSTLSKPASTDVLVANVPAPVSVQSVPCIFNFSNARNLVALSAPVPSNTNSSTPVPPWTRPFSAEPVSRLSVRA
jgi:hypothetical protein